MTLHARTRAEIEALDIGRSPLIICDVDEVVLSFIGGFERHIGRHGLRYPAIVNEGPKGPAVARLIEGHEDHVFFLDDAPDNLRSVACHVPHAHLIHFIADARFEALCETVEEVHLRTRSWRDARAFVEARIAGATARPAGARQAR